ncbi:splicing factor 3B subunit 1-like, partial [Trifolium medium]|nr:splicing factor 3B subunit 1-like [Trifolium medium]
TDNAMDFGAGPFINRILPLLKEHTLEERQRYRLVKVIINVLYEVKDSVKPYVPEILVVIQPLLINEDYCVRLEGRDIIYSLSKVAGLDCMIAAMRPGIVNIDENVRTTTARAFSVVAYALGVSHLLPFLKTVCRGQESWQARHTGIKIVHQIAILCGPSVLHDLSSLVEIIEHGLNDENDKVKTITALSLAALAKATAPFGIDCFHTVLEPLWTGITQHSGKVLAAFLKAIGFIIPLMEASAANDYTNKVMPILIQEFQSPNEK